MGVKNETCWLNVDFAETERKKNLGSIQRMTLMEVIMGMVMKRA